MARWSQLVDQLAAVTNQTLPSAVVVAGNGKTSVIADSNIIALIGRHFLLSWCGLTKSRLLSSTSVRLSA